VAFYYCTCREKNPSATGTYRKVKVDREGICLNCGHYAVACTKEVSRGSDLFYELRVEEPKGDNYYVGEGVVHAKAEKVDLNFKPEFNSTKKSGRKEKLNYKQKEEIKKLLPRYTQKTIADIYKVSESTIKKFSNSINFKYKNKKRALSDSQVREIRNLCKTKNYREIAEMFGVHHTTISSIVRRITYKDVK
jgi:DNA-binding CsgD family transcriptional regulator